MRFFLLIIGLVYFYNSFTVVKISLKDKNQFLSIAKQFLPENPNILDSGAFDGTDTLAMSQFWPKGMLYSFEPVPEIYHWLANKVNFCANVRCFSIALSNKIGYQKFFLSEDPAYPGVNFQSGSLLQPKDHLKYSSIEFKKQTMVPTITIDKWAELYAVSHIDMMWLYMQGMELDVLKASPKILSTVKVVYTEVEFVEAYAGQGTYEDIKNFMEENGFVEYAKNFDAPGCGGWGWFGDVMFVKSTCLS